MYENFKKRGLRYYNPDGKLISYRFKRKDLYDLILELEKHQEIITGITILENPTENTYGKPQGFFITDDIQRDDLADFLSKSYNMAKEYIKNIDEKNDNIYYDITIESTNLLPVPWKNIELGERYPYAKLIDNKWVVCANNECEEVFVTESDPEFIQCPKCEILMKNPVARDDV